MIGVPALRRTAAALARSRLGRSLRCHLVDHDWVVAMVADDRRTVTIVCRHRHAEQVRILPPRAPRAVNTPPAKPGQRHAAGIRAIRALLTGDVDQVAEVKPTAEELLGAAVWLAGYAGPAGVQAAVEDFEWRDLVDRLAAMPLQQEPGEPDDRAG